MVYFANCSQVKVYKGDVIQIGAYTMRVISVGTSLGLGTVIESSSGEIISGVSSNQPGYMQIGTTALYPNNLAPRLSTKFLSQDYDKIGIIKIYWALLENCSYTSVPRPLPAPTPMQLSPTKTIWCAETTVYSEEYINQAGYIIYVASILGGQEIRCFIQDPAGKPILGTSTKDTRAIKLNGSFAYPGVQDPRLIVSVIKMGSDAVARAVIPWAQVRVCTTENFPVTDTHLECVNGICTRVAGFGPDANCIEGQPCTTTTPPPTEPPTPTGDTHLECIGGICTRVPGFGPDANCIEGQPCTAPPTPTGDTHLECIGGICTRVPGFGPDANCIEGQPCTTTTPPPPVDEVLPPAPVLGPEPALDYSGLLPFLESLYNRIRWLFNFVFDSLEWIISALGILIPKLFKFILYILSLQWVADIVQAFFERLDIWVSLKFGIDPALPFWEELVKKALAWISGAVDAAAEERMRIRGWK